MYQKSLSRRAFGIRLVFLMLCQICGFSLLLRCSAYAGQVPSFMMSPGETSISVKPRVGVSSAAPALTATPRYLVAKSATIRGCTVLDGPSLAIPLLLGLAGLKGCPVKVPAECPETLGAVYHPGGRFVPNASIKSQARSFVLRSKRRKLKQCRI